MKQLNLDDVRQYVEQNIGAFHQQRIRGLDRLKLTEVLARKNPYLYKAKYVLTAEQIVRGIVDAHISSNEETIFGDWLEGLAIFVNAKVFGGHKSAATGIDLEFDRDNIKYLVSIKSGPNWGNSRQVEKMKSDFKEAVRRLHTSNSRLHVIAVNGCCYGKSSQPDRGGYYKYCGQQFWEFISGESDLFVNIIEPLGHKAREKNDEFMNSYAQIINKFTREFSNQFCDDDGSINWNKLVRSNSAHD